MAKHQKQLLKAIGKFKENAEKELGRAKKLHKRSEELVAKQESTSASDRFLERLRQKELQASGEIAWADQILAEINVAQPKKEKKKAPDAAPK